MLVSWLRVPRRLIAVPISVACEKYWMFCGDIYLISYTYVSRSAAAARAVELYIIWTRYRKRLLSITLNHAVRVFALGWLPGTRRDLGCYLYHSEKILTYPTPPGLTEPTPYYCLTERSTHTTLFAFGTLFIIYVDMHGFRAGNFRRCYSFRVELGMCMHTVTSDVCSTVNTQEKEREHQVRIFF